MKKEVGLPDFIKLEKDVLAFWDDEHCFEKMREQNSKTGKWYPFLDGPITANNEMKLHHVWNRALKDIMLRYKSMQGYDSCFQNGFDAQGLWVEVNVEKELGLKDKRDILTYGMDNFVEKCIERVKHYSSIITRQSKRLGQWMDWEHSYFTNTDENITSIWYFLKKCYEKGWLIEKHRPMPWCSHCGTSLSEHEVADNYQDMEHLAVFFKLPIKDSDMSIVVWTTTPWTLSSNVAVAVNPELDYIVCKVKSTSRKLIICSDAKKCLKDDLISIEKTVKGSELVGLVYETCFPELKQQNFEHKIVAWDMVDATEGSGAVHIAPGCGQEDFELGEKLNLEKVCPVDENGVFYSDFGFLAGKKTTEVVDLVFDELKKRDKLYYTHKHKHRYPICWRCKNPLIFRLSKEWYLKADEIRSELIKAVDTVEWQPAFTKKRMLDWLTNMGDWNISRKRFYGLPLPFYRCEHCGELTVVGSLDELIKLSSKEEVEKLPHLHRPYIDKIEITCPKCHHKVKRASEVGDCWLDAGITPFSTKQYFTNRKHWEKDFPAECVIEMKEQIRLWFYSLLFMSVALEHRAPYKKVIGFAMLVAEDGSKFSKSGPNNISFDEVVDKYGADVLRYIFASNNMQNDTRFGFNVCDETRRKILGLWNAYVFFNTYYVLDNPDLLHFNADKLDIVDKWLIVSVNKFIKDSQENYEHQRYFNVVKDFESLIDDVSNWYIRTSRRRFWKNEGDDKICAYFSLYYALKNITKVMAPIMPFMCEHIYQNLVRSVEKDAKLSIFMDGFAQVSYDLNDEKIIKQTEIARNVINLAQRLRNENQLKIKQPLRTMYITADGDAKDAIFAYENIIKDELNIKNIVFEHDITNFNDEYLQVNFKKAGAVLKGDVQKAKSELLALQDAEMKEKVNEFKQGYVNLLGQKLSSDLFVLCFKPKKDYVIASEGGLTVVLDITLDENLMQEGLLRELIRAIQVLRKESGLKIEQRIELDIVSFDDTINKVIEKYLDKIKTEALVTKFGNLSDANIEDKITIGGEEVIIKIKG